jgi:hypothetical protein
MNPRMLRSRSWLLLLFVLAGLSPLSARAQNIITVTLTGDLQTVKKDSSGVIHLSKANCDAANPAKVSFTFTKLPETGSTLANQHVRLFFSTTSSCPETSTSTEQTPIDLPGWTPDSTVGTNQGEYLSDNGYTVRGIFQNRATAKGKTDVCSNDINNESAFICVRIRNDITQKDSLKTIQFQLDTVPPNPPVLDGVSPINAGLKVNWSAPTTGERPSHYIVTATAPGQTTVTKEIDSTANTANTSIKGLTNDVAYTVTVVALDDSGLDVNDSDANRSEPSNALEGTPIPVTSFIEQFSDDTGEDVGGCASSGAAGLAWFGVLAVLLARRKRGLLGGLFLCLFIASGNASAESRQANGELQMPPPAAGERQQSPRRFTLQLYTGPFRPFPDQSAGLNGAEPYKTVFGQTRPVLTRLEFDVDLFQKFGRLSLGGAAGFWQAVGKARNARTSEAAADTELLNLWPLSVLLTYRADFIWQRWGFPLFPYGKFGYGFVYYSDLIEGSNVKFQNPQSGKETSSSGWARGIEYSLGLQFTLDILDRGMAARLDTDSGINTSAIFVELGQTKWEGNGGLFLGGNVVSGGLLIAF